MRKDFTFPESIQDLADKRYGEWLEQLNAPSSVDAAQVKLLLVASDYIYRWALKKPQWIIKGLESVLDESFLLQKELEHLAEDFSLELSEFDIKQKLRLERHYYSILIAIYDVFQRDSIRQVTYYQSQLADVVIVAAYRWTEHQLSQQYGKPIGTSGKEQTMLILAMGKLGGRELNFSSDIDLIFCFPEDGETDRESKPIENQKFFIRLGQKFISLLSDITYDGFVYRVDMRLRPYGQSGALVMNFNSLQDYYVEQGREWERFAMIKARVLLAQSEGAAQSETAAHYKSQLENIIRPFSYRRYIDFSVLESIRQLKQKIASELLRSDSKGNIKLGEGGIRELEFIVQSLQLIGGGRHPVLQTKNWWYSIETLQEKEFIPGSEAEPLIKTYEFLRKLENALQIVDEAQTQHLPDDEHEQLQVAFLVGFSDWDSLLEALHQHQDLVTRFFKGLFHDPHDDDKVSEDYDLVSQWIEGELSHDKQQELEKRLAVNASMVAMLSDFREEFSDRKIGSRGLNRLDQLLPHLLIEVGLQPQPETTLQRCIELLQGIGRRTAYFEMLAENLPVLEYLVQLVARSRWLAKQMSIYPSLLDELLFPSNFGKQLSKEDLANQLRQALIRIELGDIEEQLVALGSFKQSSQFKIAAGDLTGRFDISAVSQQLTDVAEVIVEYLLQFAWRETVAKYGVPKGCEEGLASGFLVLGYGKLGGDELGYGSDLDLVFLYQGDSQSETSGKNNTGEKSLELHQFYTRLTQRLVHYLGTRTQQGIMYEVDTRLRPSGRSGMLVSHIDAFEKYQHNEAWTWEHQALVRARPIVGDDNLLKAFMELRGDILAKPTINQPNFPQTDNEQVGSRQSESAERSHDDLAVDVVKMRQKMRQNLDRSDKKLWDVKQGKGGLVDIEFLVQYWALRHSRDLLNNIPCTEFPFNNVDWLKLLAEHGFISQEVRDQLVSSYRIFRDVGNHNSLQSQPQLIPLDELESEKHQVLELWNSTFSMVNVE